MSPEGKVFGLSQDGYDGRLRNPAFSGRRDTWSGKKAGFLRCPAHMPETSQV
ncbi:Uncharacterized protein dnm_000760 [Desulfonema magnum]|uniref:Uncharacterized protein n=1 Tax=Desulfonema magnum TaxID=45655 RepID=A0A975BF87_9BACT|nr:Uncharacterized protein dnm_000760 [Desulfonema magnum]